MNNDSTLLTLFSYFFSPVFSPLRRLDFLQQSNDFIHHLQNASFIAIDEEMSGISLPSSINERKLSKDESPDDRYSMLKMVPERYSIIQLGVCIFEQKRNPSKRMKIHLHLQE